MDEPGPLASQLTHAEIETALCTLAELADDGIVDPNDRLSLHQLAIAEHVGQLWRAEGGDDE